MNSFSPLWRPLTSLGLELTLVLQVMRVVHESAALTAMSAEPGGVRRLQLMLEAGIAAEQLADPRVLALPTERLEVMARLHQHAAANGGPGE